MMDIQGRAYVKLADLKVGDKVKVDGDFTCMEPWSDHEVKRDASGPYLTCRDGKHHLAGQADDGVHCIGVYRT